MIEKINIKKIFTNPNNPRIIKDFKFKKLVKSIKEFPEMLKLRPIVIDENNIILGGNMRFKACQSVGLKEVYIIKADNLSEKQIEQFIIKDNVGFGEWDWDIIANGWDTTELKDWGIDIWEGKDNVSNTKDYSHLDVDSKLEKFMDAKIKNLTIPFESDEFIDIVKRLETVLGKYNLNDYRELIYKILENENC
tara:strand:+ start:43 stop:621 length:579 start_codon:yes stop_codon:yes gene_type:complete